MLPKNGFRTMGGAETRRLEKKIGVILNRLRVSKTERKVLEAFLAPLKYKNAATHFHYQHSLRVAILLAAIADFVGVDKMALVYAGALHDIGKALVPADTLSATKNWTPRDAKIMEAHVLSGYQLLQGCFDFTAEIILWHHRFQEKGYPKNQPPDIHGYSRESQEIIIKHGRLLALADCYDALHRKNDRHGKAGLSAAQIKLEMFDLNRDQIKLVNDLYEAGIFLA